MSRWLKLRCTHSEFDRFHPTTLTNYIVAIIIIFMGLSVNFYKTSILKCPLVDFLDSLSGKAAQKITWVLKLIEEINIVPEKYFKKLLPYDIWEIRINF